MALECDVTIGREFPLILSCIIETGYNENQPKSKAYLGGKYVDEPMTIDVTALITDHGNMRAFTYWWYVELLRGTLDFQITLPVFGSTKTFTVKMINDLSASLKMTQVREVVMSLEIQDDVGAVIASELSAEICAIN